MKFILITGPQAVGKMTVGQELEKITNLKLFHNHRPNSLEGEIKEKNYLRINNTDLDPTTVAQKIKEKFNL